MIATLDLTGMADLNPEYNKYHLTVTYAEDGETYIDFTTNNYYTFLSFLVEEDEIFSAEDYISFKKNNEFYLEVLI